MSMRPVTEDDLHGLVDGRLDPARQVEVSAWVAAHPDTAERVAVYAKQGEMLRAAFAPVAEEPIPGELDLARMIEERRRPSRLPRWAMAAAALILVSVGAAGGWSLRGLALPNGGGIEALAGEAAASYRTYASDRTRPVEVRADDRDALAAWTAQSVGGPVAIPDLAAAGYRLMGGRVVPTEHGPAALFMYDDDHGKRLVVLARPMQADRDMPMALRPQGALGSVAWADDGLGYSLVGALSPERLHPLADLMRRQIRGKA